VTAAVIIGCTAGAQSFRSEACFARHAGTAPIPANSGKPSATAYTAAAIDNSTAPSTSSPWAELRHRTSRPGKQPKAVEVLSRLCSATAVAI
jgi:transposase IS116/IS110/IS902 family protein